MQIFGKKISDYARFARIGMILILLMGVTRFVVGISGVPYERVTHFLSMTILTFLLFLVYGYRVAVTGFGKYRHILPVAAALAVSMYGFIVAAILTEASFGLHGYFHYHSLHALAENLPSGLNGIVDPFMNVPTHVAGQLLAMVAVVFLGWGSASLVYLLRKGKR